MDEGMRSGLFAVDGVAAGEPMPLEGVSVEATIRDYGARVVVSERYRNLESRPIEAVYKFPLDEGAAVCGFEAEIDGRRLSGRVEERENAFAVYDDALAAGHGAYLLDEERADVFTASVGNVPPGKSVVLRIRRCRSCRSRATRSASRCRPRSRRATLPPRTARASGRPRPSA